MLMLLKRLAGPAVIFAAVACSGPASAAVVSCPGTAATTDREFTLDTTPGSSCLLTGVGNINGNNDAINLLGYITLDKSDNTTTGVLEGSLTIGAGTFSINAPGFMSLVLALKSGEGQLDPDWAAFLLPPGVFSGTWTISSQGFSHANLYGLRAETPLPGAIWLMGSVLASWFGMRFWRRRLPAA